MGKGRAENIFGKGRQKYTNRLRLSGLGRPLQQGALGLFIWTDLLLKKRQGPDGDQGLANRNQLANTGRQLGQMFLSA